MSFDRLLMMMIYEYRVGDKSLAQLWKLTSYSDQDLLHWTKPYGVQTTAIYCCCLYCHTSWYIVVSLVAVACLLPGSGEGIISTSVCAGCCLYCNGELLQKVNKLQNSMKREFEIFF